MHGVSAAPVLKLPTRRRRNSYSLEEARDAIRDIAMTAESEEEAVERLTEAGFDGEAADIEDIGDGYKLSVWGPHDEVIRV